ncbi:uncharacterized protein FTOL_07908 [Fusarium torulosum]|uniref:Uncharacterized protein n=1 Tax=Fusarium torulosum TaxID=33205 RepID=A0AAE8MCB2_9HYPO|nr:uncharacterized protein FTOL_07908 [Fusarium torulosum]
MDKLSSPETNVVTPGASEPSTVSIKSLHRLKELLQDLNKLPTNPPSIFLDAMGIGQDELIDLQIWIPPINKLYSVNFRRLGNTVLSSVHDNLPSRRTILESDAIPKVGFDIRGLSKLSRDGGESRKFLAGFAKCIDEDISSTNAAKVRWLTPGDTTNMHISNSLGHVHRKTMRRVELFPALWAI